MINEERLVRLFLDLCAIDSPPLQEANVIRWTKAYLEGIGLEVTEDHAGEALGGNGNNLIAWRRGSLPNAPKVFLSAHFDTVEPTPGLVVEEREGVFYSATDTILGADDKGGMAPAIEAVHALIESGEPHGDVCLLLSVCEEIGLKGAGLLELNGLDLDFGYVLDTGPPVGSFVTRTSTKDNLDITITGRPAHAGKAPEEGINAVAVAARAIGDMKLGRISPETTANVGTIEGGSARNVVCASVRIRAEARSTSLDELDAQVNHMIERFETAAREAGAIATIDHIRDYVSYDMPPDAPVVTIGRQASRNLGLDPKLRTTLGGSDANVFNAKGCASIVLATGMDKIHTHDECISRQDLVLTAQLSLEILREAGRRERTA